MNHPSQTLRKGAEPGSRRRRLLTGIAAAAGLAAGGFAGIFLLSDTPGVPETAAGRTPLRGMHFLDGKERMLALEDFRGRVLLLNLWATWCAPCRKEMPALDRLQKQLGGPGFEVVAVSLDRDLQAVREFYRQNSIRFLAPYIDASGEVAAALGSIGIPTTLLVDRQGRELWRKVGPAEWDAPSYVGEIRRHVEAGAKP